MADPREPAAKPSFVRRRYLVDARLQLSIVWRTVALAVFLLLTVLIGLLLPIVHDFETPGDADLASDAATVFLHLHRNLWWIALVCIVLPALLALQSSHRVAGPLVRVKRMLVQLAQGRLPPPLRTRRADYLKPEVALLNDAVGHLGEQMQRMRESHRHLQKKLVVVAANAAVQADDQARWQLQAASAAADALGAMLQQYQVDEAEAPVATEPARGALVTG